jgi:hypothetical protein
MLIAARTTPGKDCCTEMRVDPVQKLVLDACHHRPRAAEASSRDEQWAQELQARQGCKPWGHRRVQLEGSLRGQELWEVLETAGCH